MSRLPRLVATTILTFAIAPATAAMACENTGLTPAKGNLGKVRAAVICLHNEARAAHGLAKLKPNKKLRRAAKRHSRFMVSASTFAHGDVGSRIRRAGYRGGLYGENIAWATGQLATAAEIHRAWMRSPGHRANILRPQFRQVGIGIALGAATGGRDGATYTADFGARR